MSEVSSILDHAKAFLSKALHGSEAEVHQLIEDSKPLFEAFKADLLASIEQLKEQVTADVQELAAELAPLLAEELAKVKAAAEAAVGDVSSTLPPVDPTEPPAPAAPADDAPTEAVPDATPGA